MTAVAILWRLRLRLFHSLAAAAPTLEDE